MKKILLSSVMIAAMSVFVQDGNCGLRDWFRSKIHKTQVKDTETSKKVNTRSRAAADDNRSNSEVSIADRGIPEVVITAIKEMQEKVKAYQNNHSDNQPAHCEGIVNYMNSVCSGIARSKQIRVLNTQSNNLSRWLRKLDSSDSDNSDMYELLREFEGFLNSIRGKFKGKQADLIRKLLQKLAVIDQREIQHQNDETSPALPSRNNASNVDEEKKTPSALPSGAERVDVDEEEETSVALPSGAATADVGEEEETSAALPSGAATVDVDGEEETPPLPPTQSVPPTPSAHSAPVAPVAPPPPPAPSAPVAPVAPPAPQAPQAVQQQRSGGITAADIQNVKLKKSDNSTAKDAPATPASRGDLLAEIQKGKKLRSVSKPQEENEIKTSTKNKEEPSNMMEELMKKMNSRRQAMREDETDDDDGEW